MSYLALDFSPAQTGTMTVTSLHSKISSITGQALKPLVHKLGWVTEVGA